MLADAMRGEDPVEIRKTARRAPSMRISLLLTWKETCRPEEAPQERPQRLRNARQYADPIAQGRDAQRPEFAVGFQDEHSFDGIRSVGFLPERKRQFTEPPLQAVRFDVREVLPVHPGAPPAFAGANSCWRGTERRHAQNLVTADLVVQRVEAIASFCLRFRV
jgi:hypothetical protein